jgi:hypothetical protein
MEYPFKQWPSRRPLARRGRDLDGGDHGA